MRQRRQSPPSRSVCYSGEVGDRLIEVLYILPARLVLSTEGGDIYSMRAAVDFVSHCPKLLIVGTGCIFSAGVPIMASAKNRVATINTRFMVHRSVATGLQGTARDLDNERREMELADEFMIQVLGEKTKKSRAFWAQLIERTTFFGTPEALEWGLIAAIL
jgi:ATP-dependent protease ClpP protease subunit